MSEQPSPNLPKLGNPFGRLIGVRVDRFEPGHCLTHLDVSEGLYNPNGVLHGGALVSLADTGMGAAVWATLSPAEGCATVELKMNFLKPVTAGRLACETTVLRRGRTTAVLESRITNGEALVAVALGTYAIFPRSD